MYGDFVGSERNLIQKVGNVNLIRKGEQLFSMKSV